jgi:hypothetical protein
MVCDEAHRIRETSNSRFTPRARRSNDPQIRELINASKTAVFFIDDDQVVRPGEIGSSDYIRVHAKQNSCTIFDYELNAQFRCAGSDAMVASKTGGWVACPNEPRIRALSWKDVEDIAGRFTSLNCYDHKKLPGSILKIEKVNFLNGKQIDIFGFAISTKRYVLYRYDAQGNIVIVDAKAHGLGYLASPKETIDADPEGDWVLEGWRWVLEGEVATPRPVPEWFSVPAMMRMTVSTPAILGMLKGFTRPYNFVYVPLMFQNLYPAGKDPSNFGLIMPFSKRREDWLNTKATDTHSGKQYSIGLLDPKGRTKKIEVKCYGNILGAYREHPESKFVGSGGKPCDNLTRGLLRRSQIVASRHRYIGKETSRRWEQGDDMSVVDFSCAEYSDGNGIATEELRQRISKVGIRKIARETGLHTDTVTLIARGNPVKNVTLAKVGRYINPPAGFGQ